MKKVSYKKRMAKKWGKKFVTCIDLEPYAQQLIVVCNGQFSDAVRFLKKQKSKNAEETLKHIEEHKDLYKDEYKNNTGHACVYSHLPKGYVMLISHQDGWIETSTLIMHESLHVVHYVLRQAGLMLSSDSEEAFTYLQQEICQKILKKMY